MTLSMPPYQKYVNKRYELCFELYCVSFYITKSDCSEVPTQLNAVTFAIIVIIIECA